jgi:hypothetical protein
VVKVLAQVLLLEAVVAVIDMLLQFLSVREKALAAAEPNAFAGESTHGLHHLLVEFEVYEETALRVDEVVTGPLRHLLQPLLRLQDQTIQRIYRGRRHACNHYNCISNSYVPVIRSIQ